VRGKPPTKNGTWACLFARWGGKILRLPGLLNSLWANVRRWARLKISNFSEIEFSFRVHFLYVLTISSKLKPKIRSLKPVAGFVWVD
jgi:hypothetical protein